MSWLEKLLPAKIAQTDPSERRQVPEGLWIKCPSCETVLYKTDLEHNQNVCPSCTHHFRIGARARIDSFLDAEGRYEGGHGVTIPACCRRDLDWHAEAAEPRSRISPTFALSASTARSRRAPSSVTPKG